MSASSLAKVWIKSFTPEWSGVQSSLELDSFLRGGFWTGLKLPLIPFLIELFQCLGLSSCIVVPNSCQYIYSFTIEYVLVRVQPTMPLFRTSFLGSILVFSGSGMSIPKKRRILSLYMRHSFLGTPLEEALPICKVPNQRLGVRAMGCPLMSANPSLISRWKREQAVQDSSPLWDP